MPGLEEDDSSEGEEAEEVEPQRSAGGDASRLDQVSADTWEIPGDIIIREHHTPRTKLFVPEDADFPTPGKYIDILRTTETNIEEKAEAEIKDFWTEVGPRKLSVPWTGRTLFQILRPKPPDGKKWVAGRLTKIQATTRPDSIWPEIWQRMSAKQKKEEIEAWSNQKPLRDEARKKKYIFHILGDDIDEYNKVLKEAKESIQYRAPRR